jgi:hypothetical protein
MYNLYFEKPKNMCLRWIIQCLIKKHLYMHISMSYVNN